MKPFVTALAIAFATPVAAQTPGPGWACTLDVTIRTGVAHGTLAEGAEIAGTLTYRLTREMQMGSETRSYLTDGTVRITAADGTGLTGRVRTIHVVRSPHWADYVSFDMADVEGDLGGVTSYEDPMLLSYFAARGALDSFDMPYGAAGWAQFDDRQTFQVHTPDTMWTLPGTIVATEGACTEPT